jgi:hypothetical protein
MCSAFVAHSVPYEAHHRWAQHKGGTFGIPESQNQPKINLLLCQLHYAFSAKPITAFTVRV